MARISRGFPQQSANSAGQVLGPREPATLRQPPPVVTTLSINLASGVLTNQRRAQQRRSEQVRWQPQRRVLPAVGIGNDSPSSGIPISTSGTQYAQQFTVGQAVRLADVQLVLGFNNSPTDGVIFELHADSGGTPDVPVLASVTARARDFLSGSGGLFSIPLGATLAAGSYWIVATRTGATDASNNIVWYDIGGAASFPATTATNTGSGWATGAFSRALTLLTQLVYDDISGLLPMIGVKPPTQVATVAPFAPIQVNQAQGWLVNQRRAQQRRTTSFFVKTPPVRIPPVVTTLEVNFAARNREPIKRFPLQGWEGETTQQTGGLAALDSGSLKTPFSGVIFGGTGTGQQLAMSLVSPTTVEISRVFVELSKTGAPADNAVVSIQTDSGGSPSGVALASDSFSGSGLSTSVRRVVAADLPVTLTAGVTYWVVLSRDGALDATNAYAVSAPTPDPSVVAASLNSGVWASTANRFWYLTEGPSFGTPARFLGPKPPLVVGVPPVVMTLEINFAARGRETIRRFPRQDFEQSAGVTSVSNRLLAGSFNLIAGGSGTQEAFAEAIVAPVDVANPSIAFIARQTGSPVDNLVVSIQSDAGGAPSGSVLWTTSISAALLSNAAAPAPLVFAVPLSFSEGTVYWVVWERDGARDLSNAPTVQQASLLAASGNANLPAYGGRRNSGVWTAGTRLSSAPPSFISLSGVSAYPLLQRAIGPKPPLVVELPKIQPPLKPLSVAVPLRARSAPLAKSLLFPPQTLAQPPPNPPIAVSLAAVKTRNTNTRRFPLPGWDGGVTQDGSVAWSPLNVIDYFNRANENPLSNGGRWVRIASGLAVMQIISNVAAGSTSTTSAMAWASLGSVGDSQIACTISTLPAVSGDTVNLYLRIGGINSGLNVETGYLARWQAQTGIVEIFRLNGDNTTTLLATTTIAAPVVGDRLLFQVIGSTMVFSVNQGAAWTAVLSATDATYASGDIGFGGRGTTFRVDDVQGGLLASGSGQQGNPSRNLGPRPPQLITPLPPLGGLAVNCLQPDRLSRRFRRQLPSSVLSPPPITATFIAPALSVNCLSPDRLSRRFRRQLPTTALQPPTVLRVFAAGRPALVSTRPRPIIHRLAPPTVVRIPSVEQREQTIGVSLARIRPRTTRSLLPQTIVAAAQFTAEPISVTLTRIRPRRTARALFPPTTLQVFSGPTVSRVRIRPHATVHALSAPTVVFIPAVEQQRRTLRTPLARIRPRPTTTFLNPPTVVRVPSVEQQEDTVRVFLVRVRPRHTVATLTEPTVLQTFAGPSVHVTRIRPRPTRRLLTPPTVTTVPSVEQAEETIRVTLVRARPRPTVRTLSEPTVLQVFPGTLTPLIHTRPRPTIYRVEPPTVVRVPSVEQQEDTIKVSLARIRPRPTVRLLAAPTALQTFSGPRITLARIRPRPTTERLSAPTVVIPTPSQRAQTITVTLGGRTRLEMPRRAPVYDLRAPTVVSTNPVRPLVVSYVEPKNRREQARRFPNQGQRQRLVRETGTTVTNQLRDPFIGPRPPQIIDPLPGQRAQTISAALVAVRTRREIPRHTVGHFLRPPTAVIPLPTLRAQTVQVTRVRTRPRHTFTDLGAPTVIDRTLFTGPETPLTRTRPRKTTSLLAEPTAVLIPSVEKALRTIRVSLVKTRPRPTVHVLSEPTAVRVPAIEAALRTIHVTLVHTRPRPTTRTLSAPTVLRVFAAGRPALTRIRPRHTISRLGQPTTLKEFFGPAETEVAVSTVTDRRRHLPHSHLAPPTVFAPTVTTIREALTRIRPRPTTTTLSPPTVVADRFVASPIQVSLTPARRPSTRTTLAAPTVIERFVAAPITVSLAAGRRPAVTVTLSPPTVIAPPAAPVSVTITAALAVASTRRRFRIGRSFFPPVLPPYGPLKLPANTGYAVPASTANGDAVPAGFSDGDARPAAASEGRTLPVAESDGKAVPGTATTEGLK